MTRIRWVAALPSLLVGGAMALGMQVAAGLLLYGGPGFLPALSVVLATGSAALAAGLATPSRTGLLEGTEFGISSGRPGRRFLPGLPPGPWVGRGGMDEARRRWLGLLLAFTAAATFAAGWEFFRGFGARGLTQGAGLALLVALPMYAGGRLLASGGFGTPPVRGDGGGGGVGAPLLVGAGVGFLALGHLLFPVLSPTAVLLLCVVATSGGALLHGWLLDEVILVDAEAEEPVGVRVRWRRTRPPLEGVTWIHDGGEDGGGAGRGAWVTRGGDGEPLHPQEVAVETGLLPVLPPPGRVVAVGWEALPVALAGVADRVPVEGVDPWPERMRWLASELDPDEGEPPRVRTRDAFPGERLAGDPVPPAERVVVGGAAARSLPLARDRGWWGALAREVAPGGVVLVLGLEEGPGGDGLLAPLALGGEALGEGSAWVAGAGEGEGAPRRTGREGFLLFRKGGGEEAVVAWPGQVGPFTRVPLEALSGGGGGATQGEPDPAESPQGRTPSVDDPVEVPLAASAEDRTAPASPGDAAP